MTSIYPYQTQEVRDLAWACFSPSLLLNALLDEAQVPVGQCPLALTTQRQAWLQDLDRDASTLLRHLSCQRSRRLGVYFEHLWHFFLQNDPAVELIAHNLPVHQQGKTLGEFDCIYYCRERARYVHLELAVKFYLGHGLCEDGHSASRQQQWLGPNTADRLDLKVEHLMQRQIRLANRPEAKEQLAALGIADPVREIEVKGYLFSACTAPLPPPLAFNPARKLETWLRIGELEQYLATSITSGYLVLPKAHWLAPAHATSGEQVLQQQELVKVLSESLVRDRRPLLVAALGDDGGETRRFFVTAPEWPDPTAPTSS